jgi:hypothetical protein
MKPRHVVSAQPGYFVVNTCTAVNEDGTVTELVKEPVIAWAIFEDPPIRESDGVVWFALPITIDGVTSGRENHILLPSGRIFNPGVQDWLSEAEYIAFLNEERKKREV